MLALALGITLAIEVPIVAAFYPGRRLRMAVAAVIANAVTNLTLNGVLLFGHWPYERTLLTGEAMALVFEAVVYAMVSGTLGPGRDWPRALAASGAANLASFAAGLVLFGK